MVFSSLSRICYLTYSVSKCAFTHYRTTPGMNLKLVVLASKCLFFSKIKGMLISFCYVWSLQTDSKSSWQTWNSWTIRSVWLIIAKAGETMKRLICLQKKVNLQWNSPVMPNLEIYKVCLTLVDVISFWIQWNISGSHKTKPNWSKGKFQSCH